jgi:molybdate transport system substrate-binding protein
MKGLAAAAVLAASTASSWAGKRVIVFAAASLKNALDAAAKSWMADTGKAAAISYAGSSALAKQIQQGAPADVFISADLDWMNALSDTKLIVQGSVIKLLGNEIVLIAPADSKVETKIEKGFDLAGLIGDDKLAMADVKAVPAGKYGKAALETLGIWPSIEGKVAMAENARAALKLVSTGEAPLGIVYATDAKAEAGVRVLGTFPAASHTGIVYPVGLVAASTNPDAAEFITYVQGAKAQAIFKAHGFAVPAATN